MTYLLHQAVQLYEDCACNCVIRGGELGHSPGAVHYEGRLERWHKRDDSIITALSREDIDWLAEDDGALQQEAT